MKLTRFGWLFSLLFCLALVFVFTSVTHAQTNDFPTNSPAMSDPVIPDYTVLQKLGFVFKGYDGWIAKVLAILGTVRIMIVPFGGKIQRWAADSMNAIAARNSEDDDQYLRALFSAKWYKLLAFVLMFASIRIPTLPDLERTIELQRQAVVQAVVQSNLSTPTNVAGLGEKQ